MTGPGLQGNLSSMGIPDLLQWLSQAHKTGILEIEKGPICKKIFFQKGIITSSSSNDPREYLGQFLLRHRMISEDQLREAIDVQRKNGQMLGRVLLERKLLKEKVLMRLLTLKAEETIYSLFLWEQGQFRFLEGKTLAKESVPMSLRVEDVLLEGARRYDTSMKIRKDFPSDRTVLKKTGKPPPQEMLSHPMAARLFELVDGSRSIADICLELHAPEFSGSVVLHQMFEEECLAVAGGKQHNIPSRGEAILVLQDQAKGMLEKGNYEPALTLLEQIRSENGQNIEIPDLIRRAEAGFVDTAYKHYLPAGKIPVLTRPLESLLTEDLTPEEGFLITRVNGEWNIESIVSISPLREVEVLRILKKLREKMIIQLKDPSEPAGE